MDYAKEQLIELGISLSTLAVKGTASTIQKKIGASKARKDDKKTIELYDEIVNELIEERAEAIRIAQSYKTELEKYEISDNDIEHLNKTISTVLDIIKDMSPEIDIESFKKFKDLISVDTLKSMQLLGFNYKKAIGEPLTELCASKISAFNKDNNKEKVK
jgi:hypothetical protein